MGSFWAPFFTLSFSSSVSLSNLKEFGNFLPTCGGGRAEHRLCDSIEPNRLSPKVALCFERWADPSLRCAFGSAHLSKQSAIFLPQQVERISAKWTLLREWSGSDPKSWLGSAHLSKQSATFGLADPKQIEASEARIRSPLEAKCHFLRLVQKPKP